MLHLCLLSLLTAPVPEPRTKSIECSLSGEYIGGIDRKYSLVISGPKEHTWRYQFAMLPGEAHDYSGTYEIADDLVVFTGALKGTKDEMRFGTNFGFLKNDVHFASFFPDSERTLRYRRTWYRKLDGKWHQGEELVLTIPRDVPTGKAWKLQVTGEHVRWDESGRATRTKITETVRLSSSEGVAGYHPVNARGLTSSLSMFRPVMGKDRLDAVLLYPEGGPSGWLRGFQPGLAEPIRISMP